MSLRPAALVYAHEILGGSKTFIKAHVDNLVNYQGYYIGARRIPGLKTDKNKTFVVNNGGVIGKTREALFRFYGIAPKFYRLIREIDPVIIHAHHGTSGPSALTIAKRFDIPLIITFHGKDATMTEREATKSYRGRQLLRVKNQLVEHTSAFIAVSKFIKQRLIERGYPETKIVVHYNGIDTSYYCPNKLIPRDPVVLFVGRFEEKKGCEYLIRAMEQVQRKITDMELIFIGDGPLRVDLESQSVKRLRNYRFLGFQPSQVVLEWMNRASILAVPSITASNGDSEGMPTVLLEAQAMGLPIVSTYHSGIPEAVVEGVTALLSKERDWKTLSEHIIYLLENDPIRHQFSIDAREHACAKFSLHQQVERMEQFYSNIIDKRSL